MTSTADIDARRDELRRRFPVWRPRTLSDWLDDCAERYSERPMVLTDDRELSYADVTTESRRLADGLAAVGVQPVAHQVSASRPASSTRSERI
jgi:fatty-acyl-CoA synthase